MICDKHCFHCDYSIYTTENKNKWQLMFYLFFRQNCSSVKNEIKVPLCDISFREKIRCSKVQKEKIFCYKYVFDVSDEI